MIFYVLIGLSPWVSIIVIVLFSTNSKSWCRPHVDFYVKAILKGKRYVYFIASRNGAVNSVIEPPVSNAFNCHSKFFLFKRPINSKHKTAHIKGLDVICGKAHPSSYVYRLISRCAYSCCYLLRFFVAVVVGRFVPASERFLRHDPSSLRDRGCFPLSTYGP